MFKLMLDGALPLLFTVPRPPNLFISEYRGNQLLVGHRNQRQEGVTEHPPWFGGSPLPRLSLGCVSVLTVDNQGLLEG